MGLHVLSAQRTYPGDKAPEEYARPRWAVLENPSLGEQQLRLSRPWIAGMGNPQTRYTALISSYSSILLLPAPMPFLTPSLSCSLPPTPPQVEWPNSCLLDRA